MFLQQFQGESAKHQIRELLVLPPTWFRAGEGRSIKQGITATNVSVRSRKLVLCHLLNSEHLGTSQPLGIPSNRERWAHPAGRIPLCPPGPCARCETGAGVLGTRCIS